MPNARPVAQHLRCCAHVLDHAALQHAGLQYVLGAAERAGPALGLCLQPRTAQVATMPRPKPHFSPAHAPSQSPAQARLGPASLRLPPPPPCPAAVRKRIDSFARLTRAAAPRMHTLASSMVTEATQSRYIRRAPAPLPALQPGSKALTVAPAARCRSTAQCTCMPTS